MSKGSNTTRGTDSRIVVNGYNLTSDIKKARSVFEDNVKELLKEYRAQLLSVSKADTSKLNALRRNLSYNDNHKDYGTKSEFGNYIHQTVKDIKGGELKENALSLNSPLFSEVVKGYADARARRLIEPEIRKKLAELK